MQILVHDLDPLAVVLGPLAQPRCVEEVTAQPVNGRRHEHVGTLGHLLGVDQPRPDLALSDRHLAARVLVLGDLDHGVVVVDGPLLRRRFVPLDPVPLATLGSPVQPCRHQCPHGSSFARVHTLVRGPE